MSTNCDANSENLDFDLSFHSQSPTATVFLNSSYIQPQSFNAIAYDLNRPQFTMNVNVFGYHANDKPSQYKSIIT